MFKIPFFSKFFCDIMSHIIRKHADEKINYFFELFISKNFRYTFSLSFQIGLYYVGRFYITGKEQIKEYLVLPLEFLSIQNVILTGKLLHINSQFLVLLRLKAFLAALFSFISCQKDKIDRAQSKQVHALQISIGLLQAKTL